MLKVLIIGGTGNISSSVSRLAVEKGCSLTILNRGNREKIEGAEHLTADVTDEISIRKAIAGRSWDVVADFIAFNADDAARDISVFSGRTGQFMFISSASCYAKPVTSYPITESVPLNNPYSDYAKNKIAAERTFMRAFEEDGFPVTIVRPSHTYATRFPFPVGNGGEYTIVDRIRRGLPIISPGDGTSLWTVTHSDDFAKGFTGLFALTKAIGNAYHITSPSPEGEGGAKAMIRAMKDAGLNPEDIDYINAHGTSTHLNDSSETEAIKTALGEASKSVMVSSTKSHTGHLLGAAGGIETVVCAKAVDEGFVPATINYKVPDEECDLDVVPNEGRKVDVRYAMSNSLGFGGHNATILLKKYE